MWSKADISFFCFDLSNLPIYFRYIESIYDAKQKAVSKWDKALQSTHRNTSTNLKKLPYDWVKVKLRGFVKISE